MTQWERLRTMSGFECCMCDHRLSLGELDEFYGRADEQLHGEVYCASCMQENLHLCHECSGKYTAGEMFCSGCEAGIYGMVG